MNLKNYTSFFHDGSINEIDHCGNKVIIFMESAEIDKEDLTDDISLSKNDRIRGKLHLAGVRSIKKNNQPHFHTLQMEYEDAEIFHLKLEQNKVEFQIKWSSYPPKLCIEDFSTVEIEADKIWWENIPDFES